MKINNFMNIFSSELKLKLLIHFYTCTCVQNCVNDLVQKFGTTQANISKHLIRMAKEEILSFDIKHKHRIYKINKQFLKKWKPWIELIIKTENMKASYCHCCKNK